MVQFVYFGFVRDIYISRSFAVYIFSAGIADDGGEERNGDEIIQFEKCNGNRNVLDKSINLTTKPLSSLHVCAPFRRRD
jgi:hypothetical protein